jgi:nucleoside-diphosphate-sugar epimerase
MLAENFLRDRLSGRKILVTGATGFIGSYLVQKLARLGADVSALGTGLGWRPIVRDLLKEKRVRFLPVRTFWNVASLQRLKPQLKGIDSVVHLGYEMPQGATVIDRAIDDDLHNVLGTLRFVKHLPDTVSRICFASSVSVYGYGTRRFAKETDTPHPATIYATGKAATENHLKDHAKESGVSLAILRYATVYGPMETVPRAIPNFIRQVLKGNPPVINGDGKDVRDYVHVLDAVQATINALVVNIDGYETCNVGSGKGATTRQIAERIIHASGQKIQPVFKTNERASAGMILDISHAREKLRYVPARTLDAGLREEIEWFRRNPQFW